MAAAALYSNINLPFITCKTITHSFFHFSPTHHKQRHKFPLHSPLKLNSNGCQPSSFINCHTHFKSPSSSFDGTSSVEASFEVELEKLLSLLPYGLRRKVDGHPELPHLIEIVMDLGRKPLARFPSGDFKISEDPVTFQDLEQAISVVGDFADDNRAGIDRSLHRISAIRNRRGCIIGLTCRVGRAISGSADMIRDMVEGGGSLLLIGPPGVGKTTVIREIARMLADDYKKRVVIVDTSNEIAGDGDIPHAGIGNARRMQVPNVDMQHKVMIEAVENHMPQTIVIDEIGTELEALAASTIAQRGIQLVGTAHGVTIENLIKNPSLEILVGSIQSVTLGDDEALRRGVQKTILERKGPPAFTCAVEMMSKTQWRVHHSLEATVDAVLAGRPPLFEVRKLGGFGAIDMESSMMIETDLRSSACKNNIISTEKAGQDCSIWNENADENADENDYTPAYISSIKTFVRDDSMPLCLFTYEISEDNLEQVLEVMGLEDAVELTDDIGAADALLALHSKIKQNSWIKEMAKFRNLPVFVVKTNTTAQMARAMRAIFGMDSLGFAPLGMSNRVKKGRKIEDEAEIRRNSSVEIDALEEARLAIEHIVIPKGQPVELLPRSSEIIALQMKLVEDYKLAAEKAGSESNSRVRILPLHSCNKESSTSDPTMDRYDNSVLDVKVTKMTSGTTVSRLPLLPDW